MSRPKIFVFEGRDLQFLTSCFRMSGDGNQVCRLCNIMMNNKQRESNCIYIIYMFGLDHRHFRNSNKQ